MERAGFSRIQVPGGGIGDRSKSLLRNAHNRLVLKNFLLFLWTTVLVAFIFAALRFFDHLGNFSDNKKKAYQGITGALTLLVGLSVFDAFKTLAKEAPEFILAHSRYGDEHRLSPGECKERELIEKIENWFDVAKLARVSLQHKLDKPREPLTAIICILWICVFLATQTAVALFNVGAQTVDGSNFTHTFINPYSNDVRVPDLSCYFNLALDGNSSCPLDESDAGPRDLGALMSTAHNYGLGGLSATQGWRSCAPYNDTSQILATDGVQDDPHLGSYIPLYYCRTLPGHRQYAHRFLEYSPEDNSSTYPSFSDRLMTASSGPCRRYQYVSDGMKDGLRNYTIKADNGTETTLVIAEQNEALAGTTYVYEGVNLPPDAGDPERVVCGPRCIWIWAHLSPPYQAPGPNVFYQCPITVDPVTSATNNIKPEQNVSDPIAKYAAASIALSGRPREPKGGRNAVWKQSQYFSYGSPWSLLQEEGPDSLELVGAKMAEFALRSFAILTQRNPRISLQGRQPVLGAHMDIQWGLMAGVGATVVIVHFVLFLAIVYVSRPSVRTAREASGRGGRQAVPQHEEAEGHRLEPYRGHTAAPSDVTSVSESRRSMVGRRHSRAWSRSSTSDDDLGPEQTQHR